MLAGMPLWAAVLISLTNLTSAGQFAGTNLMIAGGGMAELALTTLVINIRYFLMSLSVSQKVERGMGLERDWRWLLESPMRFSLSPCSIRGS